MLIRRPPPARPQLNSEREAIALEAEIEQLKIYHAEINKKIAETKLRRLRLLHGE